MTVENKITIYEENGEEIKGPERPQLGVLSHGIRKDFVMLRVGKATITVVASDLERAIQNATNVRPY